MDSSATPRCLWIARDIPFPLDAGDKVYSANLARALSDAGVGVRFLGYAAGQPGSGGRALEWREIAKHKRSTPMALISPLPMQAAIHSTPAYRRLIREQLRESWDVVVIDSYGSGWALCELKESARNARGKRPLCVYVSHNNEGALWRDMVRGAQGNVVRKLAMWQNCVKTEVLERRIVRNVDLVTAITPEDALELAAYNASVSTLVLTPGYSGAISPPRLIDAHTPRRVVTLGSFRWVVKQENLRRFIEAADERFHRHGITFDVLGDVPPELIERLGSRLRATQFHGYVADTAPYFANCRLGIVPELIGGGFKLKFLDYIYGRVPVATLRDATRGLPAVLRSRMITSRDMDQLVGDIIAAIDDVAHLNALQEGALAAATDTMQWGDRGNNLATTVRSLIENQQARGAA